MGVILERCLRGADTVVRWGGDEFLAIASHASSREAHNRMERIRRSFEEQEFRLADGTTLCRTCSLGFSFSFYPFFPQDPQRVGWESLIDLADRCLYVAKRSGRNAWVGVLPSEAADPGQVAARLFTNLPELVSDDSLQVLTSLPDPGALRWELARI